MAIFDIDENINDPWAGLRDTEAYVDYVLEEVQRLLDCGELKMSSQKVFIEYVFGTRSDKPSTGFLFDGRVFTYLYYESNLSIRCDEWKCLKNFTIKEGKIERWPS